MVYYDYTYIYVALNGDIRVRHKRKVTIQNPTRFRLRCISMLLLAI